MGLSLYERAHYAVKWLAKETNSTQQKIAAELGYTNHTVLSQILTGKKKMPANLADRIASLHPAINIDFLKGLSDEMLTKDYTPVAPPKIEENEKPAKPKGIVVPPELATMFADMAATIKGQQELISSLINSNK